MGQKWLEIEDPNGGQVKDKIPELVNFVLLDHNREKSSTQYQLGKNYPAPSRKLQNELRIGESDFAPSLLFTLDRKT